MAYYPPKITVTQFYETVPGVSVAQLYGVVVGPKREIVEKGVSDDSLTSYGEYDPSSDTEYELKGLPAGEGADPDSVRLTLTDAYGLWGGVASSDDNAWNPDASRASQINAPAGYGYLFDFAGEDGEDYEKDADFGNRGLMAGDYLRIVHEGGTMISKVVGFVHSYNNAQASEDDGFFSPAAANKDTQTASGTFAIVVGNAAETRIAGDFAVDSNYEGDFAKAKLDDVYTVEITKAGGFGVAEFAVTSANGDSSTGVAPANDSTAVAIGTKGLEITMGNLETRAFELGEKFTITVEAAYTKAVFQAENVSGGEFDSSYTGVSDGTYEIQVVKGGRFDGGPLPKVAVVTSSNFDRQSAVEVEGATDTYAFDAGSLGLSLFVESSSEGLLAGERFYLTVTGKKKIGAKSVIIQDPLPKDGGINGSSFDLGVDFLIKKSEIVIPRAGYPDSGDVAFEVGPTGEEIEVKAAMEFSDPGILDDSDEEVSLKVVKANLWVSYNAIYTSGGPQWGTISSASSIAGILGPIVPENEVAYGAYKMIQNTGGAPIKYMTVPGGDSDAWDAALAALEGKSDAYHILPCTTDPATIARFETHVLAMSNPEMGAERRMFFALDDTRIRHILLYKPGTTDQWGGYVGLTAGSSPAEYLDATIPGATLVTDGVRSGDRLRVNFGIDDLGDDTYDEYAIASVDDEENLTLVSGPDGAIGSSGSPVRVEVVRTQTAQEWADYGAAQSESYGDLHFSRCFGGENVIDDGGYAPPKWGLAAAVAGLVAGAAPHEPVSGVQIQGFRSVRDTYALFTPSTLNDLAAGGTLIVAQDEDGGPIYVRHALTTDMSDIRKQEVSVVTNADSIAKFLRASLTPFIKGNNISTDFLARLRTLARQKIDFLANTQASLAIGPQVLELIGDIEVGQDPNLRTRVTLRAPILMPSPANQMDITLVWQ